MEPNDKPESGLFLDGRPQIECIAGFSNRCERDEASFILECSFCGSKASRRDRKSDPTVETSARAGRGEMFKRYEGSP